MKSISILVLTGFLAATAARATDAAVESPVEAWLADPVLAFDAAEVSLEDFQWIARPIVVFADTPADPRFRDQIMLLEAGLEELVERDVVVITDSDRDSGSEARKKLRPRGFMVVIIGKDGGVKLRKPFPWDVRELSRQIDKMPLRQEEIRARTN